VYPLRRRRLTYSGEAEEAFNVRFKGGSKVLEGIHGVNPAQSFTIGRGDKLEKNLIEIKGQGAMGIKSLRRR